MSNTTTIKVLNDRLAQIAKAREELDFEEQEIRSALAVFERYAGPQPAATTTKRMLSVVAEAENKLGPARPAKTPTLFQMAYEVIADAEQRGEGGLTGQGIVEAIGKRYWPGLKGPQVLPSVYGFAKTGRLRKTDDGLFHTVRKNEAPTAKPEGAPQITGEVDASPIESRSGGNLFG